MQREQILRDFGIGAQIDVGVERDVLQAKVPGVGPRVAHDHVPVLKIREPHAAAVAQHDLEDRPVATRVRVDQRDRGVHLIGQPVVHLALGLTQHILRRQRRIRQAQDAEEQNEDDD